MPEYQIVEDSRITDTANDEYDGREANRMSEIGKEALDQAINEASKISWPNVVLNDCLLNLGEATNAHYLRHKKRHSSKNEELQLAEKLLWVAERASHLEWIGWITEGLVLDNKTTRRYAETFEAGYENDVAHAFSNELASHDFQGKFKLDAKEWYRPLEAIALVWFCEADNLMGTGDAAKALDKLASAFSAIEQQHGFVMWDAGNECATDDKRRAMKDAANKLHAKTTHVNRDKITTYWRDNIGANVSNELAAEQLRKQFPEMAHRTLAKYVSKAKKIPPAGTL